ncbi:MAG: AMP-binding protein [Steroidobacteraceae bacterium]
MPLGDLIRHHAAIDPEAPLITLEDRVITRAQFEARCNRRARLLAHSGVKPDDLVTVALPNGLEFYETIFAIWKLGATPNPVSASLSDHELRGILEVGMPRLVVGIDPVRVPGRSVLLSSPDISGDYSAEYVPSVVPHYWKAMTSGGSTGRPKLIVDHMQGDWDPAEGGLAQQPGDSILNPGPLYHNGPFLATMLGMFSGGHVIEMSRFDPVRLLENIERHRISWLLLVPTMMHRIARLPEDQRRAYDVSSLRTVLHTAAPCPVWLKQFWIEWLGPQKMLEVYTGTERQALATISGIEALAHPGSVGRIQAGSAIRILDEDGVDVAPGEVGEIYLRPDGGRNSTYHYLGAEPRARGEWESLGDLGSIDERGYLYLSDRRVDLIIRGGVNIYPAEIEAAIDAHPLVASSIVIGLPDEDLGQTVHAVVQVPQGTALGEVELKEFLSQRLSHFKMPKSFEFVRTPLRDDAGKARRSGLRATRIAQTKN